MNPTTVVWLIRLAVIALSVATGYWIAAQHYGKAIVTLQRDQAIAANRDSMTTRQVEQRLKADIGAVDTDNWKQLKDAQDEVKRLRAALDAGTRRLLVAATCTQSMPATASSASVDTAGRAELDGKARQDYLDIRADYATEHQQLRACQAIVRTWQRQRQ